MKIYQDFFHVHMHKTTAAFLTTFSPIFLSIETNAKKCTQPKFLQKKTLLKLLDEWVVSTKFH